MKENKYTNLKSSINKNINKISNYIKKNISNKNEKSDKK